MVSTRAMIQHSEHFKEAVYHKVDGKLRLFAQFYVLDDLPSFYQDVVWVFYPPTTLSADAVVPTVDVRAVREAVGF